MIPIALDALPPCHGRGLLEGEFVPIRTGARVAGIANPVTIGQIHSILSTNVGGLNADLIEVVIANRTPQLRVVIAVFDFDRVWIRS